MSISPPRPNVLQRLTHRISSSRTGARILSHTLHRLDGALLRVTNGRVALSSYFSSIPIVMVTTRGAKSGQPRTVPLLAIPDGDKFFLVASNWGGARYPAWYHNLRAHPQATIAYGGETREYLAREASCQEYEEYWNRALELYKGYADYKNRTGGRPIPIIVLEPQT